MESQHVLGARPDLMARTPRGLEVAGYTLLALGLVLLVPASNAAAATQVYKCIDKNRHVLYTDEPCPGGELLDIRPGDADPAAVARLEREREALERRMAQRREDERRAAERRDFAAWYAREDDRTAYEYPAAVAPYDSGVTWWFPGFVRPHPPRSRPPKLPETRRFAPKSPSMPPRR